MSCGHHRRRTKISSTVNSGLIGKKNISSTVENHHKKSICARNLSEQSSQTSLADFDRFRILDDSGNDVTPRPIANHIRMNMKKRSEKDATITEATNRRTIEDQESFHSNKSLTGTTYLRSSISNMAHTGTLLSIGDRTTFDVGTRIIMHSENFLSQAMNDSIFHIEDNNEEQSAMFLPGLGLRWIDAPPEDILLSETETSFILDLPCRVICQENNDRCTKPSKKQEYSDLYVERGMQTFNDICKHEQTMTDRILTRSQYSWSTPWDMHDSRLKLNPYDERKKNRNDIRNSLKIKLNKNDSIHTEPKTKYDRSPKDFSLRSSSTFLSQDSLVKITSSTNTCFHLNDDTSTELPDIDVDALVMERILSLTTHHKEQIIYHGVDQAFSLNQNTNSRSENLNKNNLSSIRNSRLSLERLWNYTCYFTHNRNVSSLCWNEQNHNLLAVGYGQCKYNDDKEGLICCWNAKNPQFPERYYQTDAGVTSLAFSCKRPNLLAVGLFNGEIDVFDLNQNNTLPIVHTSQCNEKHLGPVWQVAWSDEDHSSLTNHIETLISISSDGRLTKWILRKEFEATDIICLKPYHLSQMTCQVLLTTIDESINNNRYYPNFVGGLCFDIHRTDRTIYLCGTDEGSIHRCSTLYNEKYLESYIGHTGPVYKVHWSPFAENIFLSAGTDWTVRLWMVGYTQPCMTFSSSNSGIFFDVVWSPKSSTMFCCVSETTIEIWDLSGSILDPICIANSTNQRTLTSIAYARDSDCIMVGTSDGAVWIYHLQNLPTAVNTNDLITIVQQSLPNEHESLAKENGNERCFINVDNDPT